MAGERKLAADERCEGNNNNSRVSRLGAPLPAGRGPPQAQETQTRHITPVLASPLPWAFSSPAAPSPRPSGPAGPYDATCCRPPV